MKIAITGATGVVGSAVLRHLLDQGAEVRALVRTGGRLPKTVEEVVGDVLNLGAVDRLLAGAQRVFHLAGVNEMCSRDPARMRRVNIEGTAQMVAGSARHGVDLIYTSSAAVLGEAEGEIGTEATIPQGPHLSNYASSKWEAEQVVLAAAERQPVVIVNPSSVQGAGRSTGTGRLLLGLMSGKLRTVVDTQLSIVDIDDCARGHLLAADKGEPGRRYLLNSFSMNMQELVEVIVTVVGEPRPVRYLPPRVIKSLAPIVGTVGRILGRTPPLCPESARTILHGHLFDGSLATRELGLVYTAPEVTLSRLYQWARREKLL